MCWVKQRACCFPVLVESSCTQTSQCLFFTHSSDNSALCPAFQTSQPWCAAEELLLCQFAPHFPLSEERISHLHSLDHFRTLSLLFFKVVLFHSCFVTFRFYKLHTPPPSLFLKTLDRVKEEVATGRMFSQASNHSENKLCLMDVQVLFPSCFFPFHHSFPVLENIKNNNMKLCQLQSLGTRHFIAIISPQCTNVII